jgi:hypothetical protein
MEERRATTPRSSPPRAARGRGQQGDKPPSPIQKIFSLLFEMCKSQHAADVRAQHERLIVSIYSIGCMNRLLYLWSIP